MTRRTWHFYADFAIGFFSLLLVLGLYEKDSLHFLNVCPFDYTAFAVSVKVGIPKPV